MTKKNDSLLAAIRQLEQAERNRAPVPVLGVDTILTLLDSAHVPTLRELEDVFRAMESK